MFLSPNWIQMDTINTTDQFRLNLFTVHNFTINKTTRSEVKSLSHV